MPASNETSVEIKKIQTTGDLSIAPLTVINGPFEFRIKNYTDGADPTRLEYAFRPVGAYTTDIGISKGTWSGIGNGKGGNVLTHVFNSSNWTTYLLLGNLAEGIGQIAYIGIDYGTTNPVFYVCYFQRIGNANSAGTLKTLIIKRY